MKVIYNPPHLRLDFQSWRIRDMNLSNFTLAASMMNTREEMWLYELICFSNVIRYWVLTVLFVSLYILIIFPLLSFLTPVFSLLVLISVRRDQLRASLHPFSLSSGLICYVTNIFGISHKNIWPLGNL